MKGKVIKFPSKNKHKKKVLFLILIFIFIYNSVTYYTFAKYNNQITGNVNIKIAEPIVEIKGEEFKKITILSPKTSYKFSVRNYNELEKINEVNMKYYIEVISKMIEYIEIHLYKGEEEILLTDYKTQEIELSNKEKQIDTYNLEIICDENIKENIQTEIEIKVYAIQEK